MSIGAQSVGEASISALADPSKKGRGTPPTKRTVIAQADTAIQPEPR
jgi:hypothetical protein